MIPERNMVLPREAWSFLGFRETPSPGERNLGVPEAVRPRGTCLNPPAVRLQTDPPFGGKPPRWSACISLALELDLKVSQQLLVAQTT